MELFSNFTFEVSWTEAIGWMGDILFVGSYVLVSRGIVDGTGKTYNWMNLGGSTSFLLYALIIGSGPIFVLEVVWASIAISALRKIYFSKGQEVSGNA